MPSRGILVADACVALINSKAVTGGVEARRSWRPTSELEEIRGTELLVIPAARDAELEDRESWTHRISVTVVAQRVVGAPPDEAACDEVDALVERVADLLSSSDSMPAGAVPVEVASVAVLDPELLSQAGVFRGAAQVTFALNEEGA